MPPSPAASTPSNPRALVIAESGLNDPKVMRPRDRGGWGCDAAWADDFHHALRIALTGETEGWYEEFADLGDAGQGLPPPARARRRPTRRFRGRRFGAPADDVAARALRGLRLQPRPGRQPRLRRPPAGRGPPARRPAHLPLPVHADALPGRGVRRARAVPVLLRPHRRGDRRRRPGRGAGASSRPSPRSASRSPTRRTRRPSSAPSSRARASRRACATLVAAALRPARRAGRRTPRPRRRSTAGA